jgi:putative tryptophan/tyrosine transport system substrate-binding protein
MRRREFMTLLGGMAATWPLAARAQQPGKSATIGYLGATTPSVEHEWLSAFLEGLRSLGWVEGRNIAIEYRWTDGRSERFAEMATELVRKNVDVIVTYGTPAVLAAKKATSVIPIVFAVVGDPVGAGLVASLARPGGNVTGLSGQQADAAGKRLELLHEVAPSVRRLAVLAVAGSAIAALEMPGVRVAARTLGLEVATFEIRRAEDIAPVFAGMKDRADALYVISEPLINTNRAQIIALALAARLPTNFNNRSYVVAGALMSHGPSIPDLFRRSATYVDKILRGAKPGDLPVEQPTTFEFVINVKTAKALGLEVPREVLDVADEVIE